MSQRTKPLAKATQEPLWFAILLVAVPTLLAAVLTLSKLSDYDFWWHLRTGQWIFEHYAIPRVDSYSYTIAGHPWIAFEWLSQCIFYGLFKIGGADAIVIFKSALTAVLALLMLGYGRSRRVAYLAVAGPVVLLALCAARSSLLERPQLFTFLLTAVYLNIFKSSKARPNLIWMLVPLQVAWVNLHGGACIVGLGLISFEFIDSLFGTAPQQERLTRARRIAIVLAACAFATVINPFGWNVYTHLFGTVDFKTRELISEWAPLKFDTASRVIWMPLVAAEVFSAAAWLGNPRRRWADAFTWLAFFILSFRAFRFATESALVFGQLFAGDWAAIAGNRTFNLRATASLLALSLGISTTMAWGFETAFSSFFLPGLGVQHDAGAAIDYASKAGLKGPLFNSYDLGGEIIWYDRDLPVFVDGRNFEYGPDFTSDAMHWFEPEVWNSLEAKWNFQMAIVQNGHAYLCETLDNDPAWSLVYWDDEALIYVRKDGPNAAIAKRLGYRYLKPNRLDFDYLDAAVSKDIIAMALIYNELERSITTAPMSVNPRLLMAHFLLSAGRAEDALKVCDEAIRVSPDRAEPYFQSGVILKSLGRLDQSQERLDIALRLAFRYGDYGLQARVLDNLAEIAYRQGDRAKAASLLHEAIDKDPNDAAARRNLSNIE